MATTQLSQLTYGYNVTPDQWNSLVNSINLLLANTFIDTATVGSIHADKTLDCGWWDCEPNPQGDSRINFHGDFASIPAITASCSIARPNTIVSIDLSRSNVSSFVVHFQANNAPVTTGIIRVHWIAARHSSAGDPSPT